MSLDPWWITGFVDGEGSFCITCAKRTSAGYPYVGFTFTIGQKEHAILKDIQAFFGCGGIGHSDRLGMHYYRVTKRADLNNKIVPFFDQYPLRSKKSRDYALWRGALIAIGSGVQRDPAKMRLLEYIRANMNNGGTRPRTKIAVVPEASGS